jgi:chemotaxis protein CheZ
MDTHSQLGRTLVAALIKLREQKGHLSIDDFGEMLEQVAARMQANNQVEQFLRNEFEKIAKSIDVAKEEIASLKPVSTDDGETAKSSGIASVTEQLDAVLGMTEKATNEIMDSADKIEALANGLEGEIKDKICEQTGNIILACNFQDITGQRINKVLKIVQDIDQTVHKVHTLLAEGAASTGGSTPKTGKPIAAGEANLLEGPQLPGKAPSQADIDALFSSL